MQTDLREGLREILGDDYAIERELRPGAMSRLFLARERSLDRQVVIKVLPPELESEVTAARFQREIAVTAHLQHPHILPVLAAAAQAHLFYYVMPYVEGESLRDRLAREGQLPVADALLIAREVADALAYAHERGVVHRDVKPGNILLSRGHALVADFGLARALEAAESALLTTSGAAVGTPAYISPEQLGGDAAAVDGRADIYSLGCVLFEMLTGQPPFSGPGVQAVFAGHLLRTPPPLLALRADVPDEVKEAIERALAKSPADRFATAGDFEGALGGTPTPTPSLPPWIRPRARHARSGWRIHRVLVGLVALVTLAGALWGVRHGPANSGSSSAATAVAITSVAVLPFANLSPDREDDYLAAGMTEELINALTKVEGLRVPARTSSFAFKGKNMSVRVIADSLHVGSVLEGSVRKAGNRLKVTAQLINAADGYHLWSETYERDLKDVFAVQDEIARAITGALRAKLAGPDSARMVGRPTRDLEAYTLFLRGRHLWNRRTAGDLRKAIEYYERAITRDPQFARAHAGLAEAYAVLPEYSTVLPMSAYAKARAAATRALALDSSLAEAYNALADVQMMHDWDWTGSERTFQRAIALNPSYASAHVWYGLLLLLTGRLDESLAEMKRAKDLDPLSPIIGTALGFVLYQLGRSDAAIEEQRRTLELDPDFARAHDRIGFALLQKGLHDEAIREAERAVQLDPGSSQYAGTLAYVLAASGERDRAVPHLRELQARARREYTSPYSLALAHLALGQRDSAFAWLDRAAQARDPLLLRWLRSPVLAPLRSDARFTRLLRQMGLAR
jgi:serine/threonine protein kinase/Flp pilus assembly protein TadD